MSTKKLWEDRWQQYMLKEQADLTTTVDVPEGIPTFRELSAGRVQPTPPEQPEAPESAGMSRADRRQARRDAQEDFRTSRADLAAQLDPEGLGQFEGEDRVDPYSLGSRIKGTLDPLGVFTGDAQDAARRFRRTQKRGARQGGDDVLTLNQAMQQVGPRGGLFQGGEAEEFYGAVQPGESTYALNDDGRIVATHQMRERTPEEYASELATRFLASDDAAGLSAEQRTALQTNPLAFIRGDETSAQAADLGLTVPEAGATVQLPGAPLEAAALTGAQTQFVQSQQSPETAAEQFGEDGTAEGEFRNWVQDLPADLRTDVSRGYRSTAQGHWGDLQASWASPIGAQNISQVQQTYPWATEDMTVGELYTGVQALEQRGEEPWLGASPGLRSALGYVQPPSGLQERQIRALIEREFRKVGAVRQQVREEYESAQQIRRLIEEAYKQGKK